MSRLIDADYFNKFLQALCKAGAPYEEVVQLLDKQPTAFDMEKVVEQLEVLHDLVNDNQKLAVSQSIDIVKKGGVE